MIRRDGTRVAAYLMDEIQRHMRQACRKNVVMLLCRARLMLIIFLTGLCSQSWAQDQQPVRPEDKAPVLPPPRAVPGLGAAAAAQDVGPPLELIEFRDLPLEEAMRLLSQQSGLRIVPSAAAGK